MNRRILLCVVLALAAATAVTTGEKSKKKPAASIYTKWPFDAKEAKRRQKETAGKLKIPVEMTLQVGKGVALKVALIPAGQFLMGIPATGKWEDAKPQRKVTVTHPFYMGITEVTQGQWKALMGTERWKGQKYVKEDRLNAVSYIDWDEATEFCKALSLRAGRPASLPTEAQWEYACRAGTKTRFYSGDDASKLGDYAWYDKNAWDVDEKYAHPVGRKKPNAWGLYDMHGNVMEWCTDYFDKKYYAAKGNKIDPTGPATGTTRIIRGGDFIHESVTSASAGRSALPPDSGWPFSGFRVVLPVVGPKAPK